VAAIATAMVRTTTVVALRFLFNVRTACRKSDICVSRSCFSGGSAKQDYAERATLKACARSDENPHRFVQ
jgi:hypothetical protein